MAEHEVILASPADRDKVVVMLSVAHEMWAEINQEKEQLEIQIYPRQDGNPWVFPLHEAISAINRAKNRLLGDLP